MSLKLVMCFMSVAAGTMTGYYLYKREFTREGYFESIIGLCNCLIADMRFSQHTIEELIQNYMLDNSTAIDDNLKEYLCYVSGARSRFVISKGILRGGEHANICSFFKALGTSDCQTQIFEIENYKAKFEVYKTRQTTRLEKYAKNYVKLGFLFGLCLGILLI